MKKRVTHSSLSGLFLGLLGFGLAFLGDMTIFAKVFTNLSTDIDKTWYVLILPAIAVLLLIALVVLKIVRKEKCYLSVIALLLGVLEALVVGPLFLAQLLNSAANNVAPSNIFFTVGSILVLLALLFLIIVGLIDVFSGKKVAKAAKKEKKAVEEEDEDEDEEDDDEVEVEDEGEDDEEEEELVEKKTQTKIVKKEAEKKVPPKKEPDIDRIYHVMKRKKDEKWIVKIAQSGKAIKVFNTQKGAVEYAESLAENNNGVVKVFASKGANKGKIIK